MRLTRPQGSVYMLPMRPSCPLTHFYIIRGNLSFFLRWILWSFARFGLSSVNGSIFVVERQSKSNATWGDYSPFRTVTFVSIRFMVLFGKRLKYEFENHILPCFDAIRNNTSELLSLTVSESQVVLFASLYDLFAVTTRRPGIWSWVVHPEPPREF